MMIPMIPIECELAKRTLTAYYRHWGVISPDVEVVGMRNGKPLCRPVEEIRANDGSSRWGAP